MSIDICSDEYMEMYDEFFIAIGWGTRKCYLHQSMGDIDGIVESLFSIMSDHGLVDVK